MVANAPSSLVEELHSWPDMKHSLGCITSSSNSRIFLFISVVPLWLLHIPHNAENE